jgi:subtilase family serine protease
MNDKTGGIQRRRHAGALAVVAAVAVLAAACSGSTSSSAGSASTGSATYRADLAYAQCMRAHGLANFPNPNPSASFSISGQPNSNASGPAAQANNACEHLLSSGSAKATSTATAGPPGAVAANCLTGLPVACYTPGHIRVAYGIQPLLDRGIDGRGVTVVLPEEAETGPARPQPLTNILQAVTDIRQDMANFDGRFGLPPARIQVMTTTLAGSSASPWLASVEEVVDTEMVHAVAPDATIVELPVAPADVSTPAEFAATWATAVRIAARTGQVISQSGIGQDFNLGEDSFTSAEAATINSALQYAAARHVTVVVASGDYGAIGNGATTPVKQVSMPASEPLVLAAGGTRLTANPATGAYVSETAWNDQGGQPSASGGGFSHLFARPAYQDGVPGIGATRGVPDVAADAASGTCMAFAMLAPGGSYELVPAGGTSVAAPFWGGLIALADQEAGHPLGFVNPAIYRIARGPLYHKAFHDITTGNNTVTLNGVTITGYQAGPGWDPVTGWGTPDAQVLIPLLAR